MTTKIDELDDPTEWGSIIGTALLHPERRDEMERRAELKIACSHAAFCQCGAPLEQRTAFLTKIDGRAAGITCEECFRYSISTALDRATHDTDSETARQNTRRSLTARTWNRDYTGAEILEMIAAPKPKKPSRKKPAAFSPQEIAENLIGASEYIWVFHPMVLRPTPAALQKLTGKRYKSSAGMIAQGLHVLCNTKHGAELFTTPEVEGIVTLTDPDQLRTYSADARKLRTCERNTTAGGKWYAPIGENSPLVYRVAGENVAVLMPMN